MSETPTAVPEPGAPDAAVTRQTRRRIIPSPHRGRPRPSATPLARVARARTRPHYRRGGRRSIGHRDVLTGGRRVWDGAALARALFASARHRRAGDVRAHRAGDEQGHRRRAARVLQPPAALHRGGAALHRQHHQRRRGPWRDGGERADARARDSVHPDPGDLRRRHPAARDLHPLSSLRAHPEAADTLAGGVPHHRDHRPARLERAPARDHRAADTVHASLFRARRRGDRHDHQPLPLLLAGLGGGRGEGEVPSPSQWQRHHATGALADRAVTPAATRYRAWHGRGGDHLLVHRHDDQRHPARQRHHQHHLGERGGAARWSRWCRRFPTRARSRRSSSPSA